MLLLLSCELSCHGPAETVEPATAEAPAAEAPGRPPPCDLTSVDGAVATEAVIDGRASPCERAWFLGVLDQRAPDEGPWHEEIFVAHSPDGRRVDLSDKRLLLSPGAVPDVILGPDGRTYMFYGAADLDEARRLVSEGSNLMAVRGVYGYGAVGLMVSEDGLHFEEVEEFAIRGLVRGMVVDPDVIRLPDGRYRLYYVGLPVPEMMQEEAWKEGAPHTLWYAESEDLVHWTQVGTAALGPNADPTVHCWDDERCTLAATGIDLGWSTDGGASFDFEVVQEPWGFAPEILALPDGRLRMFYNSKMRGGALRSAISRDGRSWEEEGEVLPGRLVEAMSFASDPAGGWRVYYHYWKEGYSGDTWNRRPQEEDRPAR